MQYMNIYNIYIYTYICTYVRRPWDVPPSCVRDTKTNGKCPWKVLRDHGHRVTKNVTPEFFWSTIWLSRWYFAEENFSTVCRNVSFNQLSKNVYSFVSHQCFAKLLGSYHDGFIMVFDCIWLPVTGLLKWTVLLLVLFEAACYNILFGSTAVMFPHPHRFVGPKRIGIQLHQAWGMCSTDLDSVRSQ